MAGSISDNKDLEAINDELRQSVEVLQGQLSALRLELEGLRTKNGNLGIKINESQSSVQNLQKIIESAEVETIFLDEDFYISLYTPSINAIFDLPPGNHKYPLPQIKHKLNYEGLQEDAETVLRTLAIVEKEVVTVDNKTYLVRLAPCRNDAGLVKGVVITFIDISVRKSAELEIRQTEQKYLLELEQKVEQRTKELKESRDEYQTLVENTPDMITRWDKGMRLLYANAAFEAKTGASAGSLLGKTTLEMGDSDGIAIPYTNSLKKAFAEGVMVEHFNSYENQKGEVHLYSRITPEKDLNGEVRTVLAIARDITDINKATQEIREKQELFQATIDSSPDMIQVFKAVRDDRGEIIDFLWILNNHASEKVYGDVIGKSLLTLNPGVIEEGIFETFRQVVETGQSNFSERHYVHEQFNDWFYQSSVKLNDGLLTTTIKITDLKMAEREIESGREFLRSVIDNSLDIIQAFEAVRDSKGAIVDFRWLVQNRKGYQQNGDVIGKTIIKIKPGVVATGIFERMVQVTETGIPQEVKQYYTSEQFSDNWFYQAMVKQGDGIVMTTRNITEQVRAEEELLALKDELARRAVELQRSNEDLRQFAHVASHDLKEPVRKIRTFHSRIIDEFGSTLPKDVKNYLERIESSAGRMFAMIDGVLHYSKLDGNSETLQKVNLNTIIDEVETDLEVVIAAKKALISRAELPSVDASPTLIHQLFYNLILNALKFAKADEPSRIEIAAAQVVHNNSDCLKITITDNGIGFRQQQAEMIFNTFTRLNANDQYEGTGLGLALCKKIVERYHGTISASGSPGNGATFTILFPLQE